MIKSVVWTVLIVFSFYLQGCGDANAQKGIRSDGRALLGNLADAEVKIFLVHKDGTKSLLWSETTSHGDTLEDIGKFYLHDKELDPDCFYVYEVSGGEDWDVDDDGVMDGVATPNNGVVRAIAKGSDIQEAWVDFKVTFLSEIVYEKAFAMLQYRFNKKTFSAVLQEQAALVVEDIDGNGEVDNGDVIRFDPVENKSRLKEPLASKMKEYIAKIREGKVLFPIIGNFNTGGYVREVVLSKDGNTAFVADGKKGVVVADVSRIENIVPLAVYGNGITGVFRLALSDDETKVYIADKQKGMVVLDVSNRSKPKFLGSCDLNLSQGYAHDITLTKDGTRAFVADGKDGVAVVDVTSAATPTVLAHCGTNGDAWKVLLSGDEKTAFVANGTDGVTIMDVSDPFGMKIVGSCSAKGSIRDIVLSADEKTLYVAAGTKGVAILDVSNPKSPKKLALCDTGNAFGIALANDEKKLFVADKENGLVEVDVNDTLHPKVVRNYDLSITQNSKSFPFSVTLSKDGSKAYVAKTNEGFVVVNVRY